MTTSTTVTFKGASGTGYTYYVYPLGTTFSARAGNYCFAKRDAAGRVFALYFGETDNLRRRLNDKDHECNMCVMKNGCNAICAHASDGGQDARLTEETDLRRAYNTPCNRQ